MQIKTPKCGNAEMNQNVQAVGVLLSSIDPTSSASEILLML